MPALPAICMNPNCGVVFKSGFAVSGSGGASFSGCISGPCPICGSYGKIPDGEYTSISHKLYANLKDLSDVDFLKGLKSIIEASFASGDTTSVKNELMKQAPNWKNVWSLLPEENVGAAVAVYSFLLSLIQTAIMLYTLNSDIEKNVFINQSYQYFYDNVPQIHQQEDQQQKRQPQLKKVIRAIKQTYI